MKYETPELEIVKFDVENTIMTSGILGGGGEYEGPFLPVANTTDLDESFDN